jgi:hypothetical protein
MQGEVQEVVAYAVASVFTPEGKRRQGYASHMMRLLHWVVSNADFRSSHRFPVAWGSAPTVPEGYGNGLFSVLYSDVGPDYYSQCGPIEEKNGGWVVDKPISTIIPLSSFSTDSPARWRPLDLAALEQTWQEDALVVGQEVGSSSYPVVAFLPTGGVAATQVIRTMDAVSGELPLRVWGTRLDDPSSLTFATWSLEIDASGPKSLIVTRLRVADLDHFADLVSQLMKAAGEAGVREVEIWNLAAEFVQMVDALGGKTEARTEHLPSIKFYLSQGREHRPELLLNEKYGHIYFTRYYCLTVHSDLLGVDRRKGMDRGDCLCFKDVQGLGRILFSVSSVDGRWDFRITCVVFCMRIDLT